MKLAQISIL